MKREKTIVVAVRLKESDYKVVQQVAKLSGFSVGSLIRSTIEEQCKAMTPILKSVSTDGTIDAGVLKDLLRGEDNGTAN